MDQFLPKIREASEKISYAEEKRIRLAGFLKGAKADFAIYHPVEKAAPSGIKIAGVDGGTVKDAVIGRRYNIALVVAG
jgi:hypothetical protein